jgi:uncharacterized iron-regulated membrane protein
VDIVRFNLTFTAIMRIRALFFWLHLTAGVVAGVVVLIMSITGVALTYEKQVLEWADRGAWSAPSSARSERLSPETLLARVREARPEAAPTMLTLRHDPAAPVTLSFEGAGTVLVDPTSGQVIGAPPGGLRTFFRVMTSWHRWLAFEGASRPVGKAVTGAANLMFLFIVLSGIYLWLPKIWSRTQLRQILWFRSRLSSKARDFNWHNVIGIWSAVPLAIVVAGAVPISYPWASNLVYQIVGEEPPRPQAGPGGAPNQAGRPDGPAGRPGGVSERGGAPRESAGEPREASAPPAQDLTGLDSGFLVASGRSTGWRSIGMRLPRRRQQPFTFTVDEGYAGQPQKRGTLTVARSAVPVPVWETFADQSRGRRLRSWFRFAHTGEYYGLFGQTIAGIVSAGGVVLVWTGLALAFRRFVAWVNRRRARPTAVQASKAA